MYFAYIDRYKYMWKGWENELFRMWKIMPTPSNFRTNPEWKCRVIAAVHQEQSRVDSCRKWLSKHRYHINKLEAVLRLVDNSVVQFDEVSFRSCVVPPFLSVVMCAFHGGKFRARLPSVGHHLAPQTNFMVLRDIQSGFTDTKNIPVFCYIPYPYIFQV